MLKGIQETFGFLFESSEAYEITGIDSDMQGWWDLFLGSRNPCSLMAKIVEYFRRICDPRLINHINDPVVYKNALDFRKEYFLNFVEL